MQMLEKWCKPSKLYHFEVVVIIEMNQLILSSDKSLTERAILASKAANSPFIAEELKGQVKYTICKGQITKH